MKTLLSTLILFVLSSQSWAWEAPFVQTQLTKADGNGIYNEVNIVRPQIFLTAVVTEDHSQPYQFKIIFDGETFILNTSEPKIDECGTAQFKGQVKATEVKNNEVIDINISIYQTGTCIDTPEELIQIQWTYSQNYKIYGRQFFTGNHSPIFTVHPLEL